MNNKAFGLIELVIYMAFVVLIGTFLVSIWFNFFTTSETAEKAEEFSNQINNFKKEIYTDWYNNWEYYDEEDNSVFLSKNNENLYKKYECNLDWLNIYQAENTTGDINTIKEQYDSFQCNNMSINEENNWYMLNINYTILWDNYKLNYFIYNN